MIHALNLGGGASSATSAAVIADNVLVRGDGGARGIQGSTWTLSDAGLMSATHAVEDNNGLLITATAEEGRALAGIASGLSGKAVVGANVTLAGVGVEGSSAVLNGIAIRAIASDAGAVPLQLQNSNGHKASIFYPDGSSANFNFTRVSAIADPSGGGVEDTECRAALAALLSWARSAGFVSV